MTTNRTDRGVTALRTTWTLGLPKTVLTGYRETNKTFFTLDFNRDFTLII